jgi:trimeric autotransporter adhesin
MKKYTLILLFTIINVALFAQEKMYIHKKDNMSLGALMTKTDSIYFSKDSATIYFRINGSVVQYPVAQVDSLTFAENSNTIYVIYQGSTVKVINPLAFEGVSVAVNGADVVVTSTTEVRDINYNLSGTTTDGQFKIYSEKRYNLILNGVSISNANGAAINLQSENKVTVTLVDGTASTCTDGATYAASLSSTGVTEDQKGAFFSEGKLVFEGTGTLKINGVGTAKHGLVSDDAIEVNAGNITIASATRDGIHAGDGVVITGGTVNVTAAGDAIDGDAGNITISGGTITTTNSIANTKGITCDSTMIISGGNVNINISGNQSKGLKSVQSMTLSGGNIVINASGGVVLEAFGSGFNTSYCTGIKSDATVNLSGATVTITGSGAAFKGVSANKNINMTLGNVSITSSGTGTTYTNATGVKDSYSSAALSADSLIIVTGGTLTTNCSGAGGKGLSSDKGITIGSTTGNPTLNITTTGARFLVSGTDYNHPKAIVSAGAITIENGTNTINSKDDGIHSDISITVNGGNNIVNAISTTQGVGEGVEAPTITFNGGVTNITASNDGINATYGTVSGGTESNDGSNVFIKGGVVITAGSDAIDSNGNITITGGTTIVCGPTSSPEEGIDFNGIFNVNGGLLISAGSNANMTKAMNTTSTQRCMYLKSSAQLAATSVLRIENGAGTEIATFKPKNAVYYFHVSSPNIAVSTSHKVYFGGTYTGGNFVGNSSGWGVYTGGTYSATGATLKSTFTTSASSTVNTVTF